MENGKTPPTINARRARNLCGGGILRKL